MVVDAFLTVNDTLEIRRMMATRNLIIRLKKALKYENSFEYKFDRVQSITIQYAPDNSFRIFTWQLMVSKTEYRYFGAIQLNTPEVNLIPLSDRSEGISDFNFATVDNRQWYGALYYNIKQLEQNGKKYYLLFGYDSHNYRDRRKVLEVLHFENGRPLFGAPLIPNSEGQMLYRMLLEFHASSSVRLNFDEALDLIIFDHLITIPGRNGEGPMSVSDGSYQGLKIQDGKLVYQEKIFNQISDEAPREEPVLNAKGKDLFGRNKKKN